MSVIIFDRQGNFSGLQEVRGQDWLVDAQIRTQRVYFSTPIIAEQEAAIAQMEKYRTLAAGDEGIARRFFADAYKGKPELIEAVLGEWVEVEVAEK